MKNKKVLYAGDSWEGGPANYLLGILRYLETDFLHVPSAVRMSPSLLEKKYDVIILSDYARDLVSEECQKMIIGQVEKGAGFLMIGGWASFSGPFGKWKNSIIEKILPVTLLDHDDRTNVPGGAYIRLTGHHEMFDSFSFDNSPVLCGFNHVRAKETSRVILTAHKAIQSKNPSGETILHTEDHPYPLLVVSDENKKRTAALTTDIAPHWCGGLVDWGSKREIVPVNPKIQIEIGDLYIEFVARILRWLARVG